MLSIDEHNMVSASARSTGVRSRDLRARKLIRQNTTWMRALRALSLY